MEIDTLSKLVDSRLKCWADEIRCGSIAGDYPSINILHPFAGVRGRSGNDISDTTLLTESILHEAAQEAREPIEVLKAAYFARTVYVDRQRRAAQYAIGHSLGRCRFLTLFNIGFDIVRAFYEFDEFTVDPWTAWLHRIKDNGLTQQKKSGKNALHSGSRPRMETA